MHVKCERLDYFGRGICYVDSKVLFVYNLLPKEEAIVKITENKKKYMIGEITKYLSKSKCRVKPKCKYEKCGCQIKNMSYEDTLKFKVNKVKDILKRNSNIDLNIKIESTNSIYNYRNKITLKVKNGKLGYYSNGSNDLIEIDKCLLASDRINEIIKLIKKENLNDVKEIVIKDFDGVMVVIDGNMNIDKLKSKCKSIYMNEKKVYGKERVVSTLGEYKFYISKDSFFQVNKDVCILLYNKVLDYIKNGKSIIDLFCGTGTISIFLSKHFKNVIGIDINKEAIKCANDNLKLNSIQNVKFICGNANEVIKNLKSDYLIVDPARSGLSKSGIKNILKIKPKKIVYVSCDVMSLSRDLNRLKDYYNVLDITLFDMFPWTYHVESVCLLEKYKN